MNKILKGIMKYRATDRVTMVEQFKKVKDNPHPKAVFFTCMDSRMIPTRFTETCVGDMFVVRNAGNLIPHSRNYPDEVTTTEPAALELGCVINDIRHVIVCGHSDCKAMNLLYSLRCQDTSSLDNRRLSPLKAWMCAHATTSLEKYKHLLQFGFDSPMLFEAETPQRQFVAYIDPENKFATEDKLSQINTLQQLQNIASYGFLKKRLQEHSLHIHALWFDIYTGDIYYFSRGAKRFVEINEETINKLLEEVDGRTLDGKITWSGGGVGRNLADALAKLGDSVHFISAVGQDFFGQYIKETLSHTASHTLLSGTERTPVALVVCDAHGNSRLEVGDMAAHRNVSGKKLESEKEHLLRSSLVVFDGNLPEDGMKFLLEFCEQHQIPVLFEPTELSLARKPFKLPQKQRISFITPNLKEFLAIVDEVLPDITLPESTESDDDLTKLLNAASLLVEHSIPNVIVTLGKRGVVIARRGGRLDPFFTKGKLITHQVPVSSRFYEPPPVQNIVSASGAGDCFASGFISSMLKGGSEEYCVFKGFKASAAALRSSSAVPSFFGNE